MIRNVIVISTIVLFASTLIFAQREPLEPRTDVPFWVDHWSRPPVNVYGPQEADFYGNMQVIQFPLNNYEDPSNSAALDSNAQWLKDHPNVRFYVSGYASTQGDWLYNLGLSQRRADWVKQALVSRGVDENRIKVSSGWGELYPDCAQDDEACWTRNQVVRFIYSPE